jgi:hypothetical protein
MAAHRGRSTWSLDDIAMDGAWRKIQSAAIVALWASWATVGWAVISQILVRSDVQLPAVIDLGTLLSGAAAFVGGCLAICYLAIGARQIRPITFGVIAALANFAYFWYFVDSIFTNPP